MLDDCARPSRRNVIKTPLVWSAAKASAVSRSMDRMIARYAHAVLCTLGDVVEDVVVWLHEPINYGTDTPARIVRRRGGSAANVASFAAAIAGASRFVGQ